MSTRNIDEVLGKLLDLTPTRNSWTLPSCSVPPAGVASYDPDVMGTDLKPLFETILDYIPAPPKSTQDAPFQMPVSSIDYNEFVGRIAVGRIERGCIKQNQEIQVCNYHDPDAVSKKFKATSIFEYDGLKRVPVTEVEA